MEVGDTFNDGGVLWIADKVEHQQNERFEWLKVKAHWTNFGRSPLWPKDPRTFLLDRRRRSNG